MHDSEQKEYLWPLSECVNVSLPVETLSTLYMDSDMANQMIEYQSHDPNAGNKE